MGLAVHVNVQFGAIDAERWEAVWLTGLQLLEQFPGPLTAFRVVDHQAGRRAVYSTDYLIDVGTPEEHWEVVGDLASRRTAESYELYRHLAHYQQRPSAEKGQERDILWLSASEPDDSLVAGSHLFGNKSQGYPYHYAMLAIGILLENSFPKHAVVHGDINPAQAAKTLAWAQAVLQRPFALPVVTDAPRLWARLLSAYDGEQKPAALRFLDLFRDVEDTRWNALLRLGPTPDVRVLREIFRTELGHFERLNQRGALQLIKCLYEATDDPQRVIDWVCGAEGAGRAFPPAELLKELCGCFLTIPMEERATLSEFVQGASPPMQSIESVLGRVFATLTGLPIVIDAYCDPESLRAAFASRWPERNEEFRALIQERTHKQQAHLEKTNAQLEEFQTRLPASAIMSSAWDPSEAAEKPSTPEAEFILEQIGEQRFNAGQREAAARAWGENVRTGLTDADSGPLDKMSQAEFVMLLTRAAEHHGITLTEAAWQSIDEAAPAELKSLCLLAGMPEREAAFCKWRIHLLESPDLWPLLAGTES